MDVDKIQRINALTSELRKHNFATSSEDAFQQAEQLYEDSPEQIVVEEKQPAAEQTTHLEERKSELLIQMNNKKYEQEFALLRSALNTLAQELETVKTELRKFSEQNPRPKEKQAELKTETKEAHPRQGNFTPQDVDIQKMFYFGKK